MIGAVGLIPQKCRRRSDLRRTSQHPALPMQYLAGGFMTTASGHTSAIRAKKVIGTAVKDTSGTTIGKVEDIMLDKQSSNIMYAVVGFGGFLGMGEKYHPVPWTQLDYNKDDGAYVVRYTKDQLKAAPADSLDALTRDDGMAYRDRAYEYYKVKPYWQ
jgi:sporulation protein YlmC with PRC-barrel domain